MPSIPNNFQSPNCQRWFSLASFEWFLAAYFFLVLASFLKNFFSHSLGAWEGRKILEVKTGWVFFLSVKDSDWCEKVEKIKKISFFRKISDRKRALHVAEMGQFSEMVTRLQGQHRWDSWLKTCTFPLFPVGFFFVFEPWHREFHVFLIQNWL